MKNNNALNLYKPWIHLSGWMTSQDCERWQKIIYQQLSWERPVVHLFGSSNLVPRMISFLAEKDISYQYSGLTHYGTGWPDWFCPLLSNVCLASHVTFNGCLFNLYRNGQDRMGWHSDNEPELDSSKPITSLSLGATRDFCLRHRSKKIREVLSLKSGDLLIMRPECQAEWVHSIPRRSRILESRINLTFRCYICSDNL